MGFDAIVVCIVLVFILISLYKEIIGPSFTFIIASVVLGLTGVLSPEEILVGFANEQIMVIIMLLLLGDIIRRTSIVEIFFDAIFGYAKTYNGFMAMMMSVVAVFSAFLNNTPLVAVMMPYVNNWCKKNKISPSKLLIPLSYAAILGGCATLIGTSTNLIVDSMLKKQTIVDDLDGFHLFDFLWVGGPMIVVGMLFLLLTSKFLLPDKKTIVDKFRQNEREYLVEAQLKKNSPLVGKSIEEAGLRKLSGLFLVEIIRERYSVKVVSPETLLFEGDILVFAGQTDSIAELLNDNTGLNLPMVGMMKHLNHTEIHEIVISHNSALIGKHVRKANFRGKYDAAILAIHRNGEKVEGKLGDIKLHSGDVLMVLGGPDFAKRTLQNLDFYFMTKIREIKKQPTWKTAILIAGTLSAIVLQALEIMPLFLGLITLLTILIGIKLANPKDLPKSIDYDLAIIIAMSLALGDAMMKTGVAGFAADMLMTVFLPFGVVGVMFGVYVITAVLAAYITNKAAVALVFPIALTLAVNQGYPPLPFAMLVSFAAAANFMTPIGYQTNLMIYGPGGYNFKDFFRVGFPLTFLYMLGAIGIMYFVYF